ncbi:hypothetical protein MPK66_gp176 [Erwinia phage pEa_SNUABM_2]|uniref:Uncharacterized protein n=1 Tax=Erwinia phage pEa_SNUABM_2 TaxID=2869547 RepID=A0AAE7XPI2_9CAUD|nr:hypothetical protein MPK66_gp176 [Erwinia phage pEa_SNUABM_2]QZE59420.1 hypothetical protein pEaSNUABM2_00176 [Erwinia phage pEa_SNUABM_2]QZE59756.1 hypothetical protein pEaSNUABM39_00176 [Erwinia phage pEa_SNUABM_39]
MLNKFYQKLQLIMTIMGIYDGLCDGVWGPKCIEAKRKWEMMDEFEPATPSNGLPFNGRGKLPAGMNYMHKGLDILWDKWDQARADEILKTKGQLVTVDLIHENAVGEVAKARVVASQEPVAVVSTVPQQPLTSNVLNTQTQSPAPVQDATPVLDEEEDDVETDGETEDTKQPQQNNQQGKQNSNWTKKR